MSNLHETGRSSDHEHQNQEGSMVYTGNSSLYDLMNGAVSPRQFIQASEVYSHLAALRLDRFEIDRGPEGVEYLVVAPPVMSRELNALFYFPAPYKGFGLDTNDIINDWEALYEEPEDSDRRAGHMRIPGWVHFEKHRTRLLSVLQAGYDSGSGTFTDSPDLPRLVPVIRWKKDAAGKREFIFDDLDEGRIRQIEGLAGNSYNPDQYVSILGIMYLASYSPEITDIWPKTHRYPGAPYDQSMGPTQSLTLALWLSSQLASSRLVQIIEGTAVEDVVLPQSTKPLQQGTVAKSKPSELLEYIPLKILKDTGNYFNNELKNPSIPEELFSGFKKKEYLPIDLNNLLSEISPEVLLKKMK